MMMKFDKIATWLFNPFKYIAGVKALVIGVILMLFSSFLSHKLNIRFDGVIDLHYWRKTTLNMCMKDIFISYGFISLLFYIVSFLPKIKARAIDIFGTIAIANYPMILILLIAHFIKLAPLLIIIFIMVFTTIWRIVLFYNAIKTSFGIKGTNLNTLFIIIFIIAEIGSGAIIKRDILFSKSTYNKRPTKSKFELKAENNDLTYQEQIARVFIMSMNNNDFQTPTTYFSSKLKSSLPTNILMGLWNTQITAYGKFNKIIQIQSMKKDSILKVYMICKLEKQNISIKFDFNTQNKIENFIIR